MDGWGGVGEGEGGRERVSEDKGGGWGGGGGDRAAGQEMNVISRGVETGAGRAPPALA